MTTRQAAEYYGLRVKPGGMACCPFHADRTPSLKLDQRFHCFGCQADGDVIDFTARMFDLRLWDAAVKLAKDFQISYEVQGKNQKTQRREKPKENRESRYRQTERRCIRAYDAYLKLLRNWKKAYAPKRPNEDWHPRFCEALEKEAQVEAILAGLMSPQLEERVKTVIEVGREVPDIERRVSESAADLAQGGGRHDGSDGSGAHGG